ncbi:uncharacterized protein [Apostichopus japonicus]|uniref:uncharacterized protein isoform X1 n=1 Tax=Stichopus japonicus TaxID=307972 RepID=UPI003AB2FC47
MGVHVCICACMGVCVSICVFIIDQQVVIWYCLVGDTLGGIPYAGMPAVEVVNRTKAGYRMPQPEGCPMDIYKVMAECWQESPQHRPNFSEIEYALEVILSHRAEISINRQQPSGNPDEAPYLPMVESDASNMIRRDSSLADKINLYDVLGTSADSAFHDLSSTSADSFTTDYQFAGDGVRIEPIIEEEEGPRERRFSISSYQSNPDFVGNGSASSIVSEINSDVSSGDGVRIEPIIEEEEGPRERRFSISSYQSNPDFVGNGSASLIVSEINSDVSSGESGIEIREGSA